MALAEKSMAGLFANAVANRYVRNMAMRLVHAKIRERSPGDRAGSCPAGIP